MVEFVAICTTCSSFSKFTLRKAEAATGGVL